jgi:hypothetical protein
MHPNHPRKNWALKFKVTDIDMFLLRRRKLQQKTTKVDISHLVGKSRAIAIQTLRGKTVQYVALKAGEQPPTPVESVYIVCYDSVTDLVTHAA